MATENLGGKVKNGKPLHKTDKKVNNHVPINLSNYKADVNIHNHALYLVQGPSSRENKMSVINLNNSLAESH